MAKKPYIGAIVHFVNAANGYHRPAIVVNVHNDNEVDLYAFGDTNMVNEPALQFWTFVSFDPGTKSVFVFSWHWIEEEING